MRSIAIDRYNPVLLFGGGTLSGSICTNTMLIKVYHRFVTANGLPHDEKGFDLLQGGVFK